MSPNSAIPDDEIVETGFVSPDDAQLIQTEGPDVLVLPDGSTAPVNPAPTTADIAAAAAAEEAAQPALGHEVNQAAQVVIQEPRLVQEHGTFIDLGGGDKIVNTGDGGVRLQPAPPKPPVNTEQTLSPRAVTKRELELQAGRDTVARHEEMERNRPKPVKTKAEIEAEGRSTPVFRPGEFSEYRDMKSGAASKDAGSRAAPEVKPENDILEVGAAARAAGPTS